MGERKHPKKDSLREKKWDNIFNALVELSQKLQNDRQILEGRVIHLQKVIYKTKMEQNVDSLKAIFILGLKERESIVYKHRYENAESDLSDFRGWCDYLVQKCSGTTGDKGESSQNKALEGELRKLKSEIESYKLEKNSEISVLLSEKNFVRNQYKQMENSFIEKLRKKCEEAENASEKVQMLASRVDELHATNEHLRANITKMESESIRKNEEIFQLRKEIEILKSRSGSASRTEAASNAQVKKESNSSETPETMSRRTPGAHKSTGGKAPRKRFMHL